MKTAHHSLMPLWFLLLVASCAIAGVLLAQTIAPAPAPVAPTPSGAAPAPLPTPPAAPSALPPLDPAAPAVPGQPPTPATPSVPPPAARVKPPRARGSSIDPAGNYQRGRSNTVPSRPGNNGLGTLEDAIVTEETNVSPEAATEKYRALVATFDAQRANAAQAVFRLGECLRKAGRFEEAKTQYGRILREFVDQPDLAQLSQKLLAEMTDTASVRPTGRMQFAGRDNDEFLRKDMALVSEQIAQTQQLVENGQAAPSTIIPLKRELLRLEQMSADSANAGRPSRQAVSEVRPENSGRIPSSREEDLRAIESELRKQRMELQKLNSLRGLTSTNRPELLTPRLIGDNRYQQLKDEYEQRLNATSSTNAGEEENKALEATRKKIARWMSEIYVPELEYSMKFAQDQIATLEEEAAKLKNMITQENDESNARATRKREDQLPPEAATRRR